MPGKVILVKFNGYNLDTSILTAVLAKDSKDSTYKYALLRGIVECVINSSSHHQKNDEGWDEYPFGLLIYYWLLYYYPLFSQSVFIRQKNGESPVEGAHIIPWSKSRNDDSRNGSAFCKTHHWMFDTCLLTVQPDHRIKHSKWLKKEVERIEHTLAWDRKEILLPEEERFMPSEEALEVRYERFSGNQ